MTTKMVFISILAFMFTINAGAQSETNPKLVNTFPTIDGALLVLDKWDNFIQVSDITTDDLETMEETIGELVDVNKDQKETITDQQKEISRLNQEISDLKKDYKALLKSLENIERKLDDIERKLK